MTREEFPKDIVIIPDSDNELIATISSLKAGISIMLVPSFKSEDELRVLLSDPNWIRDGLFSFYWENHFEFEDGMEEAWILAEQDESLSYEQALSRVFGSFTAEYVIDEKTVHPFFSVDINKFIFDLMLND